MGLPTAKATRRAALATTFRAGLAVTCASQTSAIVPSPFEAAEPGENGYCLTWNGGEVILTRTSPKLPRPQIVYPRSTTPVAAASLPDRAREDRPVGNLADHAELDALARAGQEVVDDPAAGDLEAHLVAGWRGILQVRPRASMAV